MNSRTSRFAADPNPVASHCGGKESFATWARADKAIRRKNKAQRARGTDLIPLDIYRCQTCCGFHLSKASK